MLLVVRYRPFFRLLFLGIFSTSRINSSVRMKRFSVRSNQVKPGQTIIVRQTVNHYTLVYYALCITHSTRCVERLFIPYSGFCVDEKNLPAKYLYRSI